MNKLTQTALLVAVAVHLNRTSEAQHDANFFCTELIARAYEVAGAPLFDGGAHLMAPGKVLHTERLVYMGNLSEVG